MKQAVITLVSTFIIFGPLAYQGVLDLLNPNKEEESGEQKPHH
jgi:hypothetical protein